MSSWIKQFNAASRDTKLLIVTLALFSFGIVFTTLYCYARLDYVRSYKTAPITTVNQK